MVTIEAKPLCGSCKLFDLNDARGNTVGSTTIGERLVRQGFCRAPFGLIFSLELNEMSHCRQPPGVYSPKEAKDASPALT